MSEKTLDLKNHIGVCDNYISKTDCDEVIKYYEQQVNFGNAYQRLQSEKTTLNKKRDTSVGVNGYIKEFKVLFANFDLALRRYVDNTGIDEFYDGFKYVPFKIQKTLPTEGYHVWHIEHGSHRDASHRVIVFSIYLNDVEEGGETEFLHQSVRVKPKKGRIVFWPASYPFVHRGNPPLKGEKYIVTGWINAED